MTNASTAALIAILVVAPLSGKDKNHDTYRAANWGDAVKTLPCAAFRKNNDGSWTQTGTIILGDGRGVFSNNAFFNSSWALNLDATNIKMIENTFGNTGETVILESRCKKRPQSWRSLWKRR